MTRKHIRYEVGTYRPRKNPFGKSVVYVEKSASSHFPGDLVIPNDPAGNVDEKGFLGWGWCMPKNWPEFENPENHFFFNYEIDQTLWVDSKPFDIQEYHGSEYNNLMVGGSTENGIQSLLIVLFEDLKWHLNFSKLSLIRFPGHYIEDEDEQREFLEHFLKHWWGFRVGNSTPYIFQLEKQGR